MKRRKHAGGISFWLGMSAAVYLLCFSSYSHAKASYDGKDTITVTGRGNTLESIAGDVADDSVFKWDASSHTAGSAANIVVVNDGTLAIGKQGEKELRETLLQKPPFEIKVEEKGGLFICHGRISSTEAKRFGKIEVAGDFGMDDASVEKAEKLTLGGYHNTIGVQKIRDSRIIDCGTGLELVGPRTNPEITGLLIRNSAYISMYFVQVSKTFTITGLVLEEKTISRQLRFNFNTTPCMAVLIDPAIDLQKVVFDKFTTNSGLQQDASSLLVKRSAQIVVTDEKDAPLAGVKATVVCEGKVVAEGVADASGRCTLVVPQCLISNVTGSGNATVEYRNEIRLDDGKAVRTVRKDWLPEAKEVLKYSRGADGEFTKSGSETLRFETSAPEAANVKNMVFNGSFEITTNGGNAKYPGIPDGWCIGRWLGGGFGTFPDAAYGIDRTVAADGKNSVKISFNREKTADRSLFLFSALFPIAAGEEYTLSASMKTDPPGLPVRFISHWGARSAFLNGNKNWERISFVTRIPDGWKGDGGRSTVGFEIPQPADGGTVWLDAVQVEKGSMAHSYRAAESDMAAPVAADAAVVKKKSVPALTISRTDTPASLDGKPDEPLWARVPPMRDFILTDGSAPAGEQTEAYAACDDRNLYFVIICRDGRMNEITAKVTEKDRDVFTDDSAEIFIAPCPDSGIYYHFMTNSLGVTADEKLVQGRADRGWNSGWQVKTLRGTDSWTAEAAIPLESLNPVPGAGQSWGLNICRSCIRKKEFSCWSCTYSGFHNPARFGRLNGMDYFPRAGDWTIRKLSAFYSPDRDEMDVQASLDAASNKPGTLLFRAEITAPSGKTATESAPLKAGGKSGEISWKLPRPEEGKNLLVLSAYDASGARLLYASPGMACEVPQRLTANADALFYTGEDTCKFATVVNLPERISGKMEVTVSLTAEDGKKNYASKTFSGVPGERVTAFDISRIPAGRYVLHAALKERSGAIIARRDVTVQKRPKPETGCETKILGDKTFLLNGKPQIPVGIWLVPKDRLDEAAANNLQFLLYAPPLREDGSIDAESARSYLDAAHKNKQWVSLNVSGILGRGNTLTEAHREKIREIISALKDHPALVSWYIADEPAESMKDGVSEVYKLVKQLDPYRVAWLVHCAPEPFYIYSGLTDVAALDTYPIPFPGVIQVATRMDALRKITRDAKPVWFVLQAYGALDREREPTPAEERCMAYLALIHGAGGLFYFTYKPNYLPLWEELGNIAAEAEYLTPVLLAPEAGARVTGTPEDMVHFSVREYAGRIYLITANPFPARAEVTFRIPESAAARKVKVLFEDREIPVKNGSFTDCYEGFARHVYQVVQ